MSQKCMQQNLQSVSSTFNFSFNDTVFENHSKKCLSLPTLQQFQ